MAGILDLSATMIDSGELSEPPMRITNELSEIADGIALVESFSNVVVLRTGEGLAVFDASGTATGPAVVRALRDWSTERVDTLVYTHGHLDHVGGSGAFAADSDERSHEPPRVVGHAKVVDRFERYRLTAGWNLLVNRRQFGGVRRQFGLGIGGAAEFLPADVLACTETYDDARVLDVGGLAIELHHARGETDDHSWAWIPAHRAIATGDFVTWVFPNAGNPQKVQRYPLEWAHALRAMTVYRPELLLPAHGLPIAGAERIAGVLTTIADVLEKLVGDVIDAMNAGAVLDDILANVSVDPDKLALPYLRPVYDEPEFVIRNIWRYYGGWWDGNPSHLKPASPSALASELAALIGGVAPLVTRAEQLSSAGEHRLASELIEFAVQAEPQNRRAHEARASIYGDRRAAESSLMAKGIFGAAAEDSASRRGSDEA